MAINPFKTKEFKALFKEWNDILIETGHKEIEDFNLPDPALKTWEKLRFHNTTSEDKIKETISYYEDCKTLLRKGSMNDCFETATHLKIWELHTEGLSVRKISLKINKKFFSKTVINDYIRKIEKKHGIR